MPIRVSAGAIGEAGVVIIGGVKDGDLVVRSASQVQPNAEVSVGTGDVIAMHGFEMKVAWRHLLTGHGQTELTVGAVAVGVLLVVFPLLADQWPAGRPDRGRRRRDPARNSRGSPSRGEAAMADRRG